MCVQVADIPAHRFEPFWRVAITTPRPLLQVSLVNTCTNKLQSSKQLEKPFIKDFFQLVFQIGTATSDSNQN